MRTTVTINDQILGELRKLAAHRRRPFRQVVEECLRAGLACMSGRAQEGDPQAYVITPHEAGLRSGIDPLHLNRLADEIDDEGGFG